MIGRVLQALIAAHHADETAVARSKRAYYSLPGRCASAPMTDVAELVDKLAKRLLAPRHRRAAGRGPGAARQVGH